eukprot:1999377-Pleurochrysis_carterae.AAC.2
MREHICDGNGALRLCGVSWAAACSEEAFRVTASVISRACTRLGARACVQVRARSCVRVCSFGCLRRQGPLERDVAENGGGVQRRAAAGERADAAGQGEAAHKHDGSTRCVFMALELLSSSTEAMRK